MGSSKKHKDRDREHKRRKKHRSRSRSRSPVRSRSRERKVKDKDRSSPPPPPVESSRERHRPEDEKRRRRGSEGSGDELRSRATAAAGSGAGAGGSRGDEQPQRGGGSRSERRAPVENDVDEEAPSGGGGASLSLSIEETNKLRAKLGLKPLEMNSSADSKGGAKEKESLKDDVHRPAINLAEKKRTEAMRQKLSDIKQKRKIADKLKKVKSLGDDLGEDDARAWVQKSRQAEEEKRKAEQRAKQLQQMEEEFGISSLVAEELGGAEVRPSYGQSHLKGLKVEHAESRFEAGQTVVLTLADRGVLDEEDDALINVDMIDLEKAEKNKINKSNRPDYKAYEDNEEDEFGMAKQRDVLKKYDEEIDGEKKKSFTLGRGGTYSGQDEKAMQRIREQLQSGKLTLETAAPRVASEYYSKEEMETFKKRTKKVRKIRKKVMKADDLLALGGDGHASGGSRDLSSRSGKWVQSAAEGEDGITEPAIGGNGQAGVEGTSSETPVGAGDTAVTSSSVKAVGNRTRGAAAGRRVLPLPFIDDTDDVGPDEDLTGIVIDDEAQNELQSALLRAIRLKQKKDAAAGPSASSERLSAQLLAIKPEPASPEHEPADDAFLPVKKEADGSIVLNVTDEFCRTLGNIPTYGQSGNREETEEELMDFEKELLEQRRLQEEEEEKGGWEEVGIDDRKVEVGASEEAAILDDEPVVTSGVASALALAHKKGFIEQDVQRKGKTVRNAEELLAKNYSIEDKRYDDIDEKYRKRGDRFSGGGGGALTEFKEKDGYTPDFRLEYIDEKGRKLNAKEAFRQLSHRFHGKGSGKKKTEKRAKKVDEELLMKQMSSTDTPLNTLSRLIEKQEKEKAPYIVLSGGQRTMTSNTVMK